MLTSEKIFGMVYWIVKGRLKPVKLQPLFRATCFTSLEANYHERSLILVVRRLVMTAYSTVVTVSKLSSICAKKKCGFAADYLSVEFRFHIIRIPCFIGSQICKLSQWRGRYLWQIKSPS